MLKLLSLKSEFLKNTSILIAGTIAAQSIPVFLQLFLRRLYSPEDFGAMAIYLTLLSMITIVASLRYESAIVLPKENNMAANLLSLAVLLNFFFCIVCLVMIIFFKAEIMQLLNFPEKYSSFLFLLPFSCLAFGIYQSMNYWLTRQKAFKASAANKIIRRSVEGTVQISAGTLNTTGGLFLGDFIGNLANVLAGGRQIIRNSFQFQLVSPKGITTAFKQYIDFPKYNAVPTLLSNAATVLPFLFVNKYYSTETVGYLDLTRLVLSIPLIFIAATVSQVFFQQATEKKNSLKSIRKDMLGIFYLLLIIIAIEFLIIILWGPVLFGFVFGERYSVSGLFSQILIFSFIMNFIGSTYSSVFLTFNKIRLNSIWQLTYFFSICTLFFFNNLDIYQFLIVYAGIEVIMHGIYCLMIYMIVRNYESGLSLNKNE